MPAVTPAGNERVATTAGTKSERPRVKKESILEF